MSRLEIKKPVKINYGKDDAKQTAEVKFSVIQYDTNEDLISAAGGMDKLRVKVNKLVLEKAKTAVRNYPGTVAEGKDIEEVANGAKAAGENFTVAHIGVRANSTSKVKSADVDNLESYLASGAEIDREKMLEMVRKLRASE